MHVYVCIYVCMYVYVCMNAHICMYLYVVCCMLYVCMYACMYVYVCKLYMYNCACMYDGGRDMLRLVKRIESVCAKHRQTDVVCASPLLL